MNSQALAEVIEQVAQQVADESYEQPRDGRAEDIREVVQADEDPGEVQQEQEGRKEREVVHEHGQDAPTRGAVPGPHGRRAGRDAE